MSIKNDPWFKVLEAFLQSGLAYDSSLESGKWTKMVKLNDQGIYPAVEFVRHPAIKDRPIQINLGARLSQRMIPVVYGLAWTPTVVGKDGHVYFHFNTERWKTSHYYRLTLAETLSNAGLILSRIKDFYDTGKSFVGEKITMEVHSKGTWDPNDQAIREFLIHLYDTEKQDLNEYILGLRPWTAEEMK